MAIGRYRDSNAKVLPPWCTKLNQPSGFQSFNRLVPYHAFETEHKLSLFTL